MFSHTPDGAAFSVYVSVSDEVVTLTVRDSGPGIAPYADLRRGASSRGSTGLGLDIVRKIIERASGVVSVANDASGGAVITAQLPKVGAL